jgi:elongation factor Ts
MQITAQMVKELREKTGAGMMKCKDALKDCNGNFEEAVDFLRKKGLASADKRSGRSTSEGLVVPLISDDRRTAVMFELNCETDFVARNEGFIEFANKLAKMVMDSNSINTVEELEAATLDGDTVEAARKIIIANMGENITIGRLEKLSIANGKFGCFDSYIHDGGRIGVLVKISAETDAAAKNEETINYAHEVALQAAAMKPLYTFNTEVPTETLAREKDVIRGQIKNDPKNSGKPEEIVIKIVEGRLNKYFKDICLMDQAYVKDDSKTIKSFGEDISKKVGAKIEVATFRRWGLGEAPEGEEAPAEASAEAAG